MPIDFVNSRGEGDMRKDDYDSDKNLKIGASNLEMEEILPAGVILLWSGAIADIPDGFALCDGNNGTPDLSGRFVVHADSDSGGTYDVGDTGGEATHTLSIDEIPSHHHSSLVHTSNKLSYGTSSYYETVTGDTGNTGGGGAHENRPPYYALAYIMKL